MRSRSIGCGQGQLAGHLGDRVERRAGRPAAGAAAEAGGQGPLGEPGDDGADDQPDEQRRHHRSGARPPCRCPGARRGRGRVGRLAAPTRRRWSVQSSSARPTAGAASAISPMPPVIVTTGTQ